MIVLHFLCAQSCLDIAAVDLLLVDKTFARQLLCWKVPEVLLRVISVVHSLAFEEKSSKMLQMW